MIKKLKPSRSVTAKCVYNSDSIRVKSGLSYTIQQMADMAEKGIAVTPSNSAQLYYDAPNANPLMYQRGVDIVDVYTAQKEARNKLKSAKEVVQW